MNRSVQARPMFYIPILNTIMMKAYIRSTLVFMAILLLNGCADLEENSRTSKQNDYSP
jgi:hypothetical protein